MNKPFWRIALTGLVAFALTGDCGSGEQQPKGQPLFEAVCGRCHSLEIPLGRHKTLEEWRRTVQAMRHRGARLTDDEADMIARYLAEIRPAPR